MSNEAGFLERPLDWVFSSPNSITVLRALKDSAEGMSGRAVARAAGMNHQTCAAAVARLEELGLLRRLGAGKTQLVRLNAKNLLVKTLLLPLLRGERDFLGGLKTDLTAWAGPRALCAVIFGSAARRGTSPGSDVDLFLLSTAQAKPALTAAADQYRQTFLLRYGLRLAPIIMTPREAAARLKKGDPLLKNIAHEGIGLGPGKLENLLK